VIKQKLAPLLYYFGYTNCAKSKYPIIEYTEHDQKMVVEFEKFI